jgi:hypothetical protein
LQAQTLKFDENLLKIWIGKTYNQPLTKTKKDKGWKVLKENDDECWLSFNQNTSTQHSNQEHK